MALRIVYPDLEEHLIIMALMVKHCLIADFLQVLLELNGQLRVISPVVDQFLKVDTASTQALLDPVVC